MTEVYASLTVIPGGSGSNGESPGVLAVAGVPAVPVVPAVPAVPVVLPVPAAPVVLVVPVVLVALGVPLDGTVAAVPGGEVHAASRRSSTVRNPSRRMATSPAGVPPVCPGPRQPRWDVRPARPPVRGVDLRSGAQRMAFGAGLKRLPKVPAEATDAADLAGLGQAADP